LDELDARQALKRAIARSGESFASLSRLIGRNDSYVQQYVSRGVPARLEADDVKTIAQALRVPAESLGLPAGSAEPVVGAPAHATRATDFVRLDQLRPRPVDGGIAFHAGWLGELASNQIDSLALLRMEGDSMLPSLGPGDQLIVDRDDARSRLRDGLYALRIEGEAIVKRLAVNPASRRVAILSDNAAYPSWEVAGALELDVIGRIVWAGRRFL